MSYHYRHKPIHQLLTQTRQTPAFTLYLSSDQRVGGSSPSERTNNWRFAGPSQPQPSIDVLVVFSMCGCIFLSTTTQSPAAWSRVWLWQKNKIPLLSTHLHLYPIRGVPSAAHMMSIGDTCKLRTYTSITAPTVTSDGTIPASTSLNPRRGKPCGYIFRA